MRVLTAIDKYEHQFLEEASTEIWREIWSKDTDITQDSVLTEVMVLKSDINKPFLHFFNFLRQKPLKALIRAGLSESRSREMIEMTSTPEIKQVSLIILHTHAGGV